MGGFAPAWQARAGWCQCGGIEKDYATRAARGMLCAPGHWGESAGGRQQEGGRRESILEQRAGGSSGQGSSGQGSRQGSRQGRRGRARQGLKHVVKTHRAIGASRMLKAWPKTRSPIPAVVPATTAAAAHTCCLFGWPAAAVAPATLPAHHISLKMRGWAGGLSACFKREMAWWYRASRRRCTPTRRRARRPEVSHGLQLQSLWRITTAAVS